MAHSRISLVLLHSCPDTVQSRLLHGTLRSLFLIRDCLHLTRPRAAFCLAIADCKFRAPLAPRILQPYYYNPSAHKLQPYPQSFFRAFSTDYSTIRTSSLSASSSMNAEIASQGNSPNRSFHVSSSKCSESSFVRSRHSAKLELLSSASAILLKNLFRISRFRSLSIPLSPFLFFHPLPGYLYHYTPIYRICQKFFQKS